MGYLQNIWSAVRRSCIGKLCDEHPDTRRLAAGAFTAFRMNAHSAVTPQCKLMIREVADIPETERIANAAVMVADRNTRISAVHLTSSWLSAQPTFRDSALEVSKLRHSSDLRP